MRSSFLIVISMLVGCKSPDCERAVHHIREIVSTAPPGSEPSPAEQALIDVTERAAVSQCTAEGLTLEQRDCILAANTSDDMLKLGHCPAIQAHKPSWLLLPPPQALP